MPSQSNQNPELKGHPNQDEANESYIFPSLSVLEPSHSTSPLLETKGAGYTLIALSLAIINDTIVDYQDHRRE